MKFYEWLKLTENVDLNSLPKSPSNSPITTYFETGQGSQYLRTSAGEVIRWKSDHKNTGGEDTGLKKWTTKSVFTPTEDLQVANAYQFMVGNGVKKGHVALKPLTDSEMAFMIFANANWRMAVMNDAYVKASQYKPEIAKNPLKFQYVNEPKQNYHILEWTERGGTISSLHLGSPVSVVKDIKDATPKNLAKFLQQPQGQQPQGQQPQGQQPQGQQPQGQQPQGQASTSEFKLSSLGIDSDEYEIKQFPQHNKTGVRNMKKGSPGYGQMIYLDKQNPNINQFSQELKASFGM